ncbi:MAG: hypothetical protein HOP09_07990 [Hyphomicrobium sp.]|nr:hypothetical protein [Hyphomicrobium sp.]
MRKIVEPAGLTLIDEVEQRIAKLTCKIAFIGQIKAGKTCVINALLGQGSLLPTDVNPSTSAITQLHFNQPSPSGDAAIFHFFNKEEWKGLASGSERLRSLTELFVPGFEETRLRQNVAVVRSRAASRLGPEYEQLLGRAHGFGNYTPEMLLRYICASEGVPTDSDVGLYSEITKSADIYFADGPFDFPVTIIDTPGTNDPFLIRDEITRSSLEGADAYVVVLSAQQPLAEGDVSLLRILHGLQRDRIVVFINRIDELGDAERDAEQVIDFVRNRLAAEFPGGNIPIIAGSARLMAAASLSSSKKWTPALAPKANHPRVRSSADKSRVQLDSGLRALTAVLDDLLATTQSAYFLRTMTGNYTSLAQVYANAAREELQLLHSKTTPGRTRPSNAEQGQSALKLDNETIAAALEVIQQASINLEINLRDLLETAAQEQRANLMELTYNFAAEERHYLTTTLARQRGPQTWTCDVSRLRQALNIEHVKGFERSWHSLTAYSSAVAANLEALIQALMPGGSLIQQSTPGINPVPIPNPSALGQYLLFDLDQTVWWRFWRTKPSSDERGQELQRMIIHEFSPLVELLLSAHNHALNEYIDTTTRWLMTMCHNIIQMLQRQLDGLDAERDYPARATDETEAGRHNRQNADTESDLQFRQATAESALECLAIVQRHLQHRPVANQPALDE